MIGNILIIDDRKIFRASIISVLREKGFNALGVPSGKMALERVRHKDIDLVILKNDLPNWSGLRTLRKIKAEIDEIVVICIADELAEETRNEYQKHGVEAIIPKRKFWGNIDKFIKELFPAKLSPRFLDNNHLE